MTRADEIADGLARVRQRIDDARSAAGRSDDVLLVVVTKTFPASDVEILAALGVTDVAENRHQEARDKRAAVELAVAGGPGLRWHMIGQVQRNKAAGVAGWADVVESVDREELVGPLARTAAAAGRVVDALVQVSLDAEPGAGRGGVAPGEALALAARIAAEPGLALRGVMGVAPHPGDPGEAFARLAEVHAAIRERWPEADRLSAGMSGDLEAAIAHGATQVRVGGAILGQRGAV